MLHLLDLADRLKQLVHERVEHKLLPGAVAGDDLRALLDPHPGLVRGRHAAARRDRRAADGRRHADRPRRDHHRHGARPGAVRGCHRDPHRVARRGSRISRPPPSVPVINALTDLEHPCQALAEMQTLRERLGGLEGRTVAWVGDGNNVCLSLVVTAAKLGMQVRVASPEGFEPDAATIAPFGDARHPHARSAGGRGRRRRGGDRRVGEHGPGGRARRSASRSSPASR